MSGRGLLLAVLVPACAAPAPGYRPTILRTIDTESDKLLSVVEDTRLEDNDPRPVDDKLVARAMMSSGLFTEEDANQLAEPVSVELSAMGIHEKVRIVGWAEDTPRVYYVFIHGGKVRFFYYRGPTLMDTSETLIPTTTAIAIHTPVPPPVEPTVTAPAVTPPDAGPRPAVSPTGSTAIASRPRPVRPTTAEKCAGVAAALAAPHVTEDEARTRLRELDSLVERQLITRDEFKCKRKEVLARL